jgi:hypothetical protein
MIRCQQVTHEGVTAPAQVQGKTPRPLTRKQRSRAAREAARDAEAALWASLMREEMDAPDRLQAQYYLRNDSLPTRFNYAAPTAFSEDAREAINISIPYQGRHLVYVKLVSTDGMQRAVAAGILSLRTQLAEDGDHIDLDSRRSVKTFSFATKKRMSF